VSVPPVSVGSRIVRHVAQVVFRLFSSLPLPALRAVGRAIGVLHYAADSTRTRVTRRNLGMCFPPMDPAQREATARRSLIETGQTILEMAWVWMRPVALVLRCCSVTGDGLLREKLARGRGLIVIAPHVGNWEVLGLFLSQVGPTTSLYKPLRVAAADELVRRCREKSGARLVPTTRGGVADLLRSLGRGEIAGILPDQVPDAGHGVFVPFFGVPALTMTLIHRLMRRTGAEAVVGVALRRPGGFEIRFDEPDAGLYAEDQAEALEALNRCVENAAQLELAQYQWEYKRFREFPPDTPDPYH